MSVAMPTRSTVRMAVVLLCLVLGRVGIAAAAEPLLFSTGQYGRVNLTAPQSAVHGNLESALHGNPVFEPLTDYEPGDHLRVLAAPVGRLDVLHEHAMNTCTASVISSDYLLTNWHCVPGDAMVRRQVGRIVTVSFVADYYDLRDEQAARRYQVDPVPVETSEELDYSILRVFGNPAERLGTLRLSRRDPRPGESLLVIHHPLGRPKHVTRGRCRAARPRPVSGTDLFHTCDTLVGSSGAPILSARDDTVIGLHYAGLDMHTGDTLNHGKRLARLARESRVLASLVARAPEPPPPPSRPVEEIVGIYPQPAAVFRDLRADGSACPECPEMVVVPSGRFTMGSPEGEAERFGDEGPQHEVSIGYPLAIGRYEVTRGQFSRFVQETGHSVAKGCWAWTGKWEQNETADWRSPGFAQTDDHPAVCVNWNDARAYAGWLSGRTGKAYRLLSEAEWEYAARARTETARYWGDSADDGCRYANAADLTLKDQLNWSPVADCRDGHVYTARAGTFQENRFGLHGMLGNVAEWVEDCWHDNYSGAPSDGTAWTTESCASCVLRGGSWNNIPWIVRSANRSWFRPVIRFNLAGFRLSRTF